MKDQRFWGVIFFPAILRSFNLNMPPEHFWQTFFYPYIFATLFNLFWPHYSLRFSLPQDNVTRHGPPSRYWEGVNISTRENPHACPIDAADPHVDAFSLTNFPLTCRPMTATSFPLRAGNNLLKGQKHDWQPLGYPACPYESWKNILGSPRQYASWELVPDCYKTLSPDHFGRAEMNNSTILSNETSTAKSCAEDQILEHLSSGTDLCICTDS